MSVSVTWGFDPSVTIANFVLTKSTDNGVTFSPLVVIPFDLQGGAYTSKTRKFGYTDSGGSPGHIYRIVSVGPFGTSEPMFAVVPPPVSGKCTIIGYISSLLGEVDRNLAIYVDVYGSRSEQRWTQQSGTVGLSGRPMLGVTSSPIVVYPDDNGVWQFTAVRGTTVKVSIPELEFEKVVEVPNKEGPVNIRDIPQVRGTGLADSAEEMNGVPAGLDGT